ncbi:MAG: gliding motility-associated C-terminal domain-containing protein, partial [Bacteroidetes bacterium]|nr:gliding motility-associated C-terminal domain-containing protein [Bacteroidota bacterium]
LTSSNGCDSIATLVLTVNNASTSNSSATICNTQLPYNWNGQSYTTAGAHVVTLVNSHGCDSIATLNLIINQSTTSNTPVSICSTALPYSWNGQSYTTAGLHSVTLVNAVGCDSIATLNLTILQTTTSTTPASTCSDQLPYTWNGQNYTTAGLHTITLVNAAGCDSIATLNLTINQVTSSNSNATTCSNQLPYSWNGQSYSDGGTYSVTLTSSTGCDSIATLHLAVNSISISSTDITICSSELPYTWNGQSWSTGGTHVVNLVNNTGCDSIATLHLTVNPTPGLAAVTSPVNYCQYAATSVLSASTTTTGSQLLWYSSATGGTGSATVPVPSSSTAGTTTYYVSQLNNGCEGPRAAITVTVNPTPQFPDQPLRICTGQHANIANLYNTTGLTSNWTINQQPVTDPTAVDSAGTYQLITTTAAGCSDTAIVNLGINPPVVANAGNDDNAEYGAPYQLNGSGGVQYQWSPSTDLNNPYIANPTATLNHDQEFVLMVMDDIGCFDLDTVKLRVLEGPTFYVPSAFTPNGDGLNDIFRPTAVGIAKLEYFSIFNRWGELVYETHDINQGWDGIYKGVKQPIGNYVWKLKGTDRKGVLKVMKGNVVLIR